MKKYKLVVIAILASVVALGAGGALLLKGSSSADKPCQPGSGHMFVVMIMDGTVDNANINAHRCDSILFDNMDNTEREIAFGPHEDHVPYNGVAEKLLEHGQSFTLTLSQTGTYHWHDHLHDEVEGYFTVK